MDQTQITKKNIKGISIGKISDDILLKGISSIISGAVFDTGSSLDENELKLLITRIQNDIRKEFYSLSLEEISEAIRGGVRRKYGFYKTPITLSTIYYWIEEYKQTTRTKKQEKAMLITENSEVPLSEAERKEKMAEIKKEIYNVFLENVNSYVEHENQQWHYYDYGNIVYGILRETKKQFKFPLSTIREAYVSARYSLKLENIKNRKTRNPFKEALNGFEARSHKNKNTVKHRIKSDVKRILLKNYVDGVILPYKRQKK